MGSDLDRDGQKHPVYIYRFLTTNTIDEKIYQACAPTQNMGNRKLMFRSAR
jgi:hypothetical protein